MSKDYFQVEAFASTVNRDDWDRLPRRVERNTGDCSTFWLKTVIATAASNFDFDAHGSAFLTDDAGPYPVITSWTDRNSASPWAARALAANDFMYWEVMRRASERGYRIFDFWTRQGRDRVVYL